MEGVKEYIYSVLVRMKYFSVTEALFFVEEYEASRCSGMTIFSKEYIKSVYVIPASAFPEYEWTNNSNSKNCEEGVGWVGE